jgi:hypothetical protein
MTLRHVAASRSALGVGIGLADRPLNRRGHIGVRCAQNHWNYRDLSKQFRALIRLFALVRNVSAQDPAYRPYGDVLPSRGGFAQLADPHAAAGAVARH